MSKAQHQSIMPLRLIRQLWLAVTSPGRKRLPAPVEEVKYPWPGTKVAEALKPHTLLQEALQQTDSDNFMSTGHDNHYSWSIDKVNQKITEMTTGMQAGTKLSKDQYQLIRHSPLYQMSLTGSRFGHVQLTGTCSGCGFPLSNEYEGRVASWGCPRCRRI